jgi:hypothetical protein
MFDHATIPGLPSPLWQAAFFLDFIAADPFPCGDHSDEVYSMSEKMGRKCDEVLVWRKKKLGW